mmetsp:Transcript_2280/g.4991  ORF Transcript_2280/g.4991 Transcript_2280/m.4991 type:complete len:266 (+) Transcript_2280:537-1334(+)
MEDTVTNLVMEGGLGVKDKLLLQIGARKGKSCRDCTAWVISRGRGFFLGGHGPLLRVFDISRFALHVAVVGATIALNDKHLLKVRHGNNHIRAEAQIIVLNASIEDAVTNSLGGGRAVVSRFGPGILDDNIPANLGDVVNDRGIIRDDDRYQRHRHLRCASRRGLYLSDVVEHGLVGGVVREISDETVLPVGLGGVRGHDRVATPFTRQELQAKWSVLFRAVERIRTVGGFAHAGLAVILVYALFVHDVARDFCLGMRDGGGSRC